MQEKKELQIQFFLFSFLYLYAVNVSVMIDEAFWNASSITVCQLKHGLQKKKKKRAYNSANVKKREAGREVNELPLIPNPFPFPRIIGFTLT